MTKNKNRTTISKLNPTSCPASIQARKSHFCYKINLGHKKKKHIALVDEFQKLRNLISSHTSLLLSVWDIFQEGGCILQHFSHSSSHFFTLYHLSCLFSVQLPYTLPPPSISQNNFVAHLSFNNSASKMAAQDRSSLAERTG